MTPWPALTTHAAAIAGVEQRLGTLEAGKLGHVIVMTGPVHRGAGQGPVRPDRRPEIRDQARGPARAKAKGPAVAAAGPAAPAARPSRRPARRTSPTGRRPIRKKETPTARRAERQAGPRQAEPDRREASSSRRSQRTKTDRDRQPRQRSRSHRRRRKPKHPPKRPTRSPRPRCPEPQKAACRGRQEPKKAAHQGRGAEEGRAQGRRAAKAEAPPFVDIASELDEDRKPTLHTGGSVLIKDATILTVTKGTIPKGSILVEKGKIKAVGKDVTAPPGVKVIDAAGLVAMPGIIDTHSHIAVQGGVNEGSLSVVPEVRVKDVVTGDDVAIYRALAGGTTTARLLHGSANTIGGQDAVAKLQYGQPGRDLIVRYGPQGVKFALGENVTRSPRRFPNTRMGVESVIEKCFEEGAIRN